MAKSAAELMAELEAKTAKLRAQYNARISSAQNTGNKDLKIGKAVLGYLVTKDDGARQRLVRLYWDELAARDQALFVRLGWQPEGYQAPTPEQTEPDALSEWAARGGNA